MPRTQLLSHQYAAIHCPRCRICLIAGPSNLPILRAGSFSSTSSGPWWENGEILMLLAAQSMAAGTLMVPFITRFVDPIVATGWHMILGGLPLVGLSLLTEQQELSTNLVQINAGASTHVPCNGMCMLGRCMCSWYPQDFPQLRTHHCTPHGPM